VKHHHARIRSYGTHYTTPGHRPECDCGWVDPAIYPLGWYDAAAAAGLSQRRIQQLVKEGRIPNLGTARRIRVRLADVLAVTDARCVFGGGGMTSSHTSSEPPAPASHREVLGAGAFCVSGRAPSRAPAGRTTYTARSAV